MSMNKNCGNNFKNKCFEKKSEELYFYCTLYGYYIVGFMCIS